MKRGRSLSGMGSRAPGNTLTGSKSPPFDGRPTRTSAGSVVGTSLMPPPLAGAAPPSRANLPNVPEQPTRELDCRSPEAKRRSSSYRTGSGIDGRLGGALRVITPNKSKMSRSGTSGIGGRENAGGTDGGSGASDVDCIDRSTRGSPRSHSGGGKSSRDGGVVGFAGVGRSIDTRGSSGCGSAPIGVGAAGAEDDRRLTSRSESSLSGGSGQCGHSSHAHSPPTDERVAGRIAESLGGTNASRAARRVSVRSSSSSSSNSSDGGGGMGKRSRADRASSSSTESTTNGNNKRSSRGSSGSNESDKWSGSKRVSSISSDGGSKRSNRSSSESSGALRVGVGECQECGESDDTEVCEGGAVLCEDCAAEAREEEKWEKPRQRDISMVALRRRSSVAPSSLSAPKNVLSAPEGSGNSTRHPTKQDFQVGRALGKGKFGNVYLAKFRAVTVALKLLWKSSVASDHMGDNVRREVEIQSRLRHPNIVRMPGFFEDPKTIYFVLDYAAGGDVYKVLRQHERGLPEEMAVRYLLGAARAVAYLHERHIIHRDIKPENLLLDSSGRVKLSDFGWSIHAVPPTQNERSTLCGTPEYVAPEMLVENPRYTKAVDVWSLGILGFELLAGVTPFRDAQVQRTSKVSSKDSFLQPAAAIAETNSAGINAALYGRIVGYKGSLETLCGEGMAGFGVPDVARTVFAGMLRPRAAERLSVEEALRLPWLEAAAAVAM